MEIITKICTKCGTEKSLNEFISTREAERQTKINHQSIINVCKNKKHCKSAGGFIWRYKNE